MTKYHDLVSTPDKLGRARAIRLYPDGQPCEVCGRPYETRMVHRHHRNSDRLDNSPANIAWLCQLHHILALHAGWFVGVWVVGRIERLYDAASFGTRQVAAGS